MSTPPTELDTQPEQKKSRKALYAVVGSVAGAAVVAASILGIEAANNQPDKHPVATAPTEPSKTPEATPTKAAEVLTVQSLEIPANLTPEQIGVALIQDRLSQWEMAGATDANTTAWHQAPNLDAFTLNLAQTNADTFTKALFVEGWDATASLSVFEKGQQGSNANSVENFFKTNHITQDQKDTFPGDREAYKRSIAVNPGDISVLSQAGDTITLSILATEHDNKDKNRISTTLSKDNQAQIEGNRFKATVTLKNVNGVEKVAAISITNP